MHLFRRVFIRNFASNFKPNSKVRVRGEALNNVLSTPPAVIDWNNVRNELISSERFLKPANVNGIVVDFCLREIRLDIAKSYLDYLKSNAMDINDGCISKILSVYYSHYSKIKLKPTQEDEADMINLSFALIQKYPLMDSILAGNVIRALTLTKEWLKSVELLEHIKVTELPSVGVYSSIISKALDEDRLDLVWELTNEVFDKKSMPSIPVFVKYIEKFRDNVEETENLFKAIRERSLIFPEQNMEVFREAIGENRCEVVEIDRLGDCRNCQSQLPAVSLNEEEFKILSKTFLDDVMIRKDVFIKTTPAELQRFKDFVQNTVPYDCVIDGLNVAYSHGSSQGPKMFAKNVRPYLLKHVVIHFFELFLRF